MVAPVDEGGPPLELLDEVAEEVWFIGIVELFNAAFRDYAAVVCLGTQVNWCFETP
jgi:hypothetical protein